MPAFVTGEALRFGGFRFNKNLPSIHAMTQQAEIEHLRKMVDTALELGGWTKIDDCPPPQSGDYLVWDQTGRYFITEYIVGAGWSGQGTIPLTHWQLPSTGNLDARLSLLADRLATEVRQELTRLRWAEKRSVNVIARLKAALETPRSYEESNEKRMVSNMNHDAGPAAKAGEPGALPRMTPPPSARCWRG